VWSAPSRRLPHLRGQRQRLHQAGPADPAALTALAVLVEREAVLHHALTTDSDNPVPEHAADADRARAPPNPAPMPRHIRDRRLSARTAAPWIEDLL
jgi:hypothetical protein